MNTGFIVGKRYRCITNGYNIDEDWESFVGCIIEVLRNNGYAQYDNNKYDITICIVNIDEMRARSRNKYDAFYNLSSDYMNWEEDPSWWEAFDAECPHCKKVVEPDLLGLCPECTWTLRGGE